MPNVAAADLATDVEDYGDPGARPTLLVHGWPDDASTWANVAPVLAAAGHRVIVPTLRGFGHTRFLSDATPRTGNSGILAMDMIALLDALGIDTVRVAGHDWGANVAEALAVGWPDRVERIAMLSTPPRLGDVPTPSFEQAQRYWYHWFMATERGAEAVREDTHGFARIHWRNWAPEGWFDEATFQAVARSFDNPDWVEVTLHSYRARWGFAPPDPRSEWLEDRIRTTKTLSLPSLFIKGDVDGVTTQASFEKVPEKFSGPFELVGLSGVGHFPTREAAEDVAEHLVSFFSQDSEKAPA